MFKDFMFADLHQHGLLSGDKSALKHQGINLPNQKIDSLDKLTAYSKKYINKYFDNQENIEKFLISNIDSAIKSDTYLISPSIDYTLAFRYKTLDDFVNFLLKIKNKYQTKIKIYYDLGISRNNYQPQDYNLITELLKSGIFHGIDLYGNELLTPHQDIVKLYKIAKKLKLQKKAHVGELGQPIDVLNLYKMLNLNEIQHGIAIASNKKLLKYFSKKDVIFNICLASNQALLGIKYSDNAARTFYDNNIKFSINTDDKLYFNKSVKEEYYELLKQKIFTEKELLAINKQTQDFIIKYYL